MRRSFLRLLVIVAVCLPLGAHSASHGGLLRRVERLLAASEAGPGRLSASPGRQEATGRTPPRLRARVIREIDERLGAGADAQTLHAAALMDLAWPDPAGTAAARAVAHLQGAIDVGGASAARLSDLSVGYLERSAAGGLLDVHQAMEAAERALALDSLYPPAWYNLAAAADSLRLDTVAVRAWRRVRALEPEGRWRAEADRRLARLSRPAEPWRAAGPPLASAAAAHPQPARIFAADTLLGAWAAATLRGDTLSAATHFARADTIGRALAGRGGDASVAEMTSAIRRVAHDAPGLRRLALAHAAYARAQALLDAREGPRALATLDSIRVPPTESPVLAQWTAYSRVVALFYSRRTPEAVTACERLGGRVDVEKLPVLAGRVQWSLGTLALRSGGYDSARARFARSAALFQRAGERQNLGTVQELEAEALFGLGDTRAAYDRLASALASLRPYRASTGLHNLLLAAASAAASRGLRHTALRLHEEDVAVASRLSAGSHAEALVARARTLMSMGEMRRVREDVERSRQLIGALPEDYRNWLEEELLVARGQLALAMNPGSALQALDSAVARIQARISRSRLVAALVYRAEARVRTGDETGALADLERAAAHRDSLRSDVQSAAVRAAMAEAGRRVFDRLVMLHANAGRARQALFALERGRAVFGGNLPRAGSATLAVRRPEEVSLDFALIGDTLLSFAVRRDTVHLARTVTSRNRLVDGLNQLRAALESRESADALRPRLARMDSLLMRPLRAWIPAGAPLVLVADGEVAAVPFPALWNPATRRYLVQDHPLRFAPTLADASRFPAAARDSAERLLFVADPAFDPAAYPGLERLGETETDARRALDGYPDPIVLVREHARRDAVLGAMRSASVFHFAGHALFDADRPSDSHLLLADRGSAGRLTAAEMERMDLRGLRLVVLSACETQRSASGRSGGFAGLSGALLAAGVGGVVGSTWRVDNELTRALMAEFHRAYRASPDGADALRRAQLRLIASPGAALRSPAAWAGFRYAGG